MQENVLILLTRGNHTTEKNKVINDREHTAPTVKDWGVEHKLIFFISGNPDLCV